MPTTVVEVDRALAARDARQVEHRIVVGERIEPGVIAERALAPALAGLDVAFEHDLRVGGHLEVDGDALDELDTLAAQGSRRASARRAPRASARSPNRRARDRARAPRPRAAASRAARRRDSAARHPCAAASACPVDAPVEDLHAVGADVAHARLGILRKDERQRDVTAAVVGPALQDRQLSRACRPSRRPPDTARRSRSWA